MFVLNVWELPQIQWSLPHDVDWDKWTYNYGFVVRPDVIPRNELPTITLEIFRDYGIDFNSSTSFVNCFQICDRIVPTRGAILK